ncbi:MAG TPA: BON domain-containing protein [Steroidobacteraceae bacterium]
MRSERDRHMDPRQRQSPDDRDGLQGQYEKDAWRPEAPRYAREVRGRRAAAGSGYERRPEHRSEHDEPYEPSEGYEPFEPGHPRDEGTRFGAGPSPRYLGTGFMGRGGPGFAGGYYGFGTGSPEPDWRSGRRYPVGEGKPDESERRVERRYPPGPKGYQRSDERLREVISERLMEASHIDSSEVTVAVSGAKVVLEGTVPERRMKHAIEDLADACPGVLDVENRILVKR